MAKAKRAETGAWTPSQVVAHNMTRARQLRGLTQAEIAQRLSAFSGAPWSDVTVAQAEGSVSSKRVRQFTANELVALARAFDLPVTYFFMPPEDRAGRLQTPDVGEMPWEYLMVLLWGHRRNFPDLAERAAPWAHASTVLIPPEDLFEPEDLLEQFIVRDQKLRREHLTPQDMVAVAFNGMARRHIRGSFAGKDLQELATNLRRLADAFEAFEGYPPGAFFDMPTVRKIAEEGPPRRGGRRKSE